MSNKSSRVITTIVLIAAAATTIAAIDFLNKLFKRHNNYNANAIVNKNKLH